MPVGSLAAHRSLVPRPARTGNLRSPTVKGSVGESLSKSASEIVSGRGRLVPSIPALPEERKLIQLKLWLERELLATQRLLLKEVTKRRRSSSPSQMLFASASGNIDINVSAEALSALYQNRAIQIDQLLSAWQIKSAFNQRFRLPKQPRNLDELLAYSLVVSKRRGESKARLRVPTTIRQELFDELKTCGFSSLTKIPGGGTLFGSTVAAEMGYRALLVMPDKKLPRNLLDLLSGCENKGNIFFVSRSGTESCSSLDVHDEDLGIHFNLKAHEDCLELPEVLARRLGRFNGLELLVTGYRHPVGWQGFEVKQIARLAGNCKGAFISGLQAIGSTEQCSRFIDEISQIGTRGLMTTLVYSEPKSLDVEPFNILQVAKSGMIDNFSINTSEACQLVKRICRDPRWRKAIRSAYGESKLELIKQARLKMAAVGKAFKRDRYGAKNIEEHPEAILAYASILQSVFSNDDNGGIAMIRVRGRRNEVVVLDKNLSQQENLGDIAAPLAKMRRRLVGSRALSSTKAILPHGWFRDQGDLRIFSEGLNNTAVKIAYCLLQVMKKLGVAKPNLRQSFRLKSGQIAFNIIAPSVSNPIFTVSLGDTNDAMSLGALKFLNKIMLAAASIQEGSAAFKYRVKQRRLDRK